MATALPRKLQRHAGDRGIRFVRSVLRAENSRDLPAIGKLVTSADRRGEVALGLIARYRQLQVVPTVGVADQTPARFPRYFEMKGAVDKLIEGPRPSNGLRVLEELMSSTDSHSGTHRLAERLAKLQDLAPETDLVASGWTAMKWHGNVFAASLGLSDSEIAGRLGLTLNARRLKLESYKALLPAFRAMPGLSPLAKANLEEAESAVARALLRTKSLEESSASLQSQIDSLRPRLEVKGFLGLRHTDQTILNELNRLRSAREGIEGELLNVRDSATAKAINAIATPHGEFKTPIPAIDVATESRKLFEELLTANIGKGGKWKVFGTDDALVWRSILAQKSAPKRPPVSGRGGSKAIGAKVAVVTTQGSTGISEPVAREIPRTQARARQVSVAEILGNGATNFIVETEGRVHSVRGSDIAGWFDIAISDVASRAGRVIGTR